ncbi:aldose epimerase family protein [Massilia horti]|uniref:Galactose-1-epimerase n=1 Tax=Massilia horti TaxID=2562153 RepID=A0A4Y9T661_9BURK|nr:galactose-1-epimerase [Massilia horti]TFW32645.1 galactose-1-epimerase [Massilia horti]
MTANYSYADDASGPGRLFTLRNDRDMAVTISERGAALMSWWAPDRYGRLADVVLGDPDCVPEHGHVADLASERFSTLRRMAPAAWRGFMDGRCVSLRQMATHGAADGFTVEVHYRLDDEGRLSIDHVVSAPEESTLELGSTPRFNLNGGRGDVGDHMLQIDADYYLKIDRAGLPLGLAPVGGTAFDFRKPAAIGPRLGWPDVQIGLAGGFDHCYRLGEHADRGPGLLRAVAQVYDPRSGRRLQVATTEVGLCLCIGSTAESAQGTGFRLQPCSHPEQLGVGQAAAVILGPRRVFRRTTVYQLSLQP